MNRAVLRAGNSMNTLKKDGKKTKMADGLYGMKASTPILKTDIDNIQLILDRFNENEKIQRKFHELESKILSILNFKDFFEILLTETETIFNVPYVWLSVIKKSSLANLINPLIHSKIIIEKTKFINRKEFNGLLGNISTPVLINYDLEPYAVFLPWGRSYNSGSIAIAPVQIDGEVVGSLNQWDPSVLRFEPDMDTSFLEQLMRKISLCLSNVAAHEKIKRFAFHDPLTGLLNRRAFEAVLNREFSRSKRQNHDLSLVFLDLDKFKGINDQFGHDAGDAALVYTAKTMKSMIREEDVVARFAGDEFVIIFPETKADKVAAIMKRIQSYLKTHPLHINGNELFISLSFGITSTEDEQINSAAVLLKKADEKLYAEKKNRMD